MNDRLLNLMPSSPALARAVNHHLQANLPAKSTAPQDASHLQGERGVLYHHRRAQTTDAPT
jgi:hypothetical protein